MSSVPEDGGAKEAVLGLPFFDELLLAIVAGARLQNMREGKADSELRNLAEIVADARELLLGGNRPAGRASDDDEMALLQMAYWYDHLVGGVPASGVEGPDDSAVNKAARAVARAYPQFYRDTSEPSRRKTLRRKFTANFQRLMAIIGSNSFAHNETVHQDLVTVAKALEKHGVKIDLYAKGVWSTLMSGRAADK